MWFSDRMRSAAENRDTGMSACRRTSFRNGDLEPLDPIVPRHLIQLGAHFPEMDDSLRS
jgi:hypothetical protein